VFCQIHIVNRFAKKRKKSERNVGCRSAPLLHEFVIILHGSRGRRKRLQLLRDGGVGGRQLRGVGGK